MDAHLTYTIDGKLFVLTDVTLTRQGFDYLFIEVNNPTPKQIVNTNSEGENSIKLKHDMERAGKYIPGNLIHYINDELNIDNDHYYPLSNTNREHKSESLSSYYNINILFMPYNQANNNAISIFSNQCNNNLITLFTNQTNNNITYSSLMTNNVNYNLIENQKTLVQSSYKRNNIRDREKEILLDK